MVDSGVVTDLLALDPRQFDAVLFDLDGVVTDTAVVHAAAWRALFDEALAARPEHPGEDHAPFTDADYLHHVDGKPRATGVRDFLASRGITLPEGTADDDGTDTVCGLANRKQQKFLAALLRDGVRPFDSTVRLIADLRANGIGTALFSASRNAREVLRAAGLEDLFVVIIDGLVAEELGLPGKPDPAAPWEAARRLGAAPTRCALVEDAVAGVQAGRRGGFGLVIGVDRHGSGAALREHGADVVVSDLAEVRVTPGFSPADHAPEPAECLVYEGYDPAAERLREALCTVGNGNFAVRGAAPECDADPHHYPGTYCAGVFNRLEDTVSDRLIDNESMVNLPNWLPLTFRIDTGAGYGSWFHIDDTEVLSYRQTLDLRCAELIREFRVRDTEGRITAVTQRRFASMHRPHVAALQMTLTPENYDGTVEFRSEIDGGVRNTGVERYRALSDTHLADLHCAELGSDATLVGAITNQTRIPVAVGARTTVWFDTEPAPVQRQYRAADHRAGHHIAVALRRDQTVTVEKMAMVVNARDNALSEPDEQVRQHLPELGRYDALLAEHRLGWSRIWSLLDIDLNGNTEEFRVLRLHLLHLAQTLSPHTVDLDVGVPARGLHGEAYRGHIFWDELFILPVLNCRFPAISRSLLAYRYRRLPAARLAAAAAGHRGAMFPWQSGSDGREESQRMHLNPMSGRWKPDASARAHHVGLAIAYNAWHYYQTSADHEFLRDYGAELIVDIARFWVSLAQFDPDKQRYVITGVIGPDEYQSGYPDAPHDGIDNNAYTNVMAAWTIARALDVLYALPIPERLGLLARLGIEISELARFDTVSRGLFVPFHDGVISQFEGYEQLAELDWDGYRARYDNIARLDRILEAENDDINRYRAGKQADVLMLFYLLPAEELTAVFDRLGYRLEPQLIADTIDYYLARTSHGSTLSAVVHSWVLAHREPEHAVRHFHDVLRSDIDDIQGGTTAEGIHLAAMAGSVDLVQRCFTGMETCSGVLKFDPCWPETLNTLCYTIRFRGHRIHIEVSSDALVVSAGSGEAPPVTVECRGETAQLAAGGTVRFG